MPNKEKINQKNQESLLILKEYCLFDDAFFTKCFDGDIESVQLILQIILNKPDLKVLDAHTQVFISNLTGRSSKLDVLAVDSEGNEFNIEIQRRNSGATIKRAGFYGGAMKVRLSEKGKDIDKLPEIYVIFITEDDVMGEGRPLYRYGLCDLDSGKEKNDGTHYYFVNGTYRGNTPLGKLMHDFSCKDPNEMFYDVLANRTKKFKEEQEGIKIMSKVIDDILEKVRAESLEEGFEKGRLETTETLQRKIARNLATTGHSLEQIASSLELTVEEAKRLIPSQT